MKLITENRRYFIKSRCRSCGYTTMIEAKEYRNQPDAVQRLEAQIQGWIKDNPRCLRCKWPGLELNVNVLREKDRRRLWVLAVALLMILGFIVVNLEG